MLLPFRFDEFAEDGEKEVERVRTLIATKGHALMSTWNGEISPGGFASTPVEFLTTAAVTQRHASLSALALRVRPSTSTLEKVNSTLLLEVNSSMKNDKLAVHAAVLAAFGWTAR